MQVADFELSLQIDATIIECLRQLLKSLKGRYSGLQLRLYGIGNLKKFGIAHSMHRGSRIDCGYLNLAIATLLHDDIAGQHCSDLVLKLQRAMSEGRIAGAKYAVLAKVHPELLPEGLLNVNIGQNPESLDLESGDDARNGIFERSVEQPGVVIAQSAVPF